MQDLGTLGGAQSWAYGINKAGLIVGTAEVPNGFGHACVWSGGAIHDLNSMIPAGSDWLLETATGVNDAGQICGTGVHGSSQRAFLLTPVSRSAKRPR